jgi:hypothetical protein
MVQRSVKRTRRKERSKDKSKRRSRVKRTKHRSRTKRTKMKKGRTRSKINKNKQRSKKKDRKELQKGGGWEGDYEWFTSNYKSIPGIQALLDSSKWNNAKAFFSSIKNNNNNTKIEFSPFQFRILKIGTSWKAVKDKDKGINSKTYPGTELQKGEWERRLQQIGVPDDGGVRQQEAEGEATSESKHYTEIKNRVEFCRNHEKQLKSIVWAEGIARDKLSTMDEVGRLIMDQYLHEINGSETGVVLDSYFTFRTWLGQDENRWTYDSSPEGLKDYKNQLINEAKSSIRNRKILAGLGGAAAAFAGTMGTGGILPGALAVGAAGHAAMTATNLNKGVNSVVRLRIPDGALPGSDFQFEYNGRMIKATVPQRNKPGDIIEIPISGIPQKGVITATPVNQTVVVPAQAVPSEPRASAPQPEQLVPTTEQQPNQTVGK